MRAVAAACAMLAATLVAAAEAELVAGPDRPGPDVPATGQSLLRELYPDGLPVPFEALLGDLRWRAGDGNIQIALIPLGRSLQRLAAHPDYFASPRVVVAVTGDKTAGPTTPRLGARIFLGYQPAAEVVETISYNGAAGRFEFEEVVGYGTGSAHLEAAERAVCVTCHQGQSPIFARPLWAETNSDAGISDRLVFQGATFHGAPHHTTVDALESFDAATDAAARVMLANRLWAEGCPDAACRAALLAAAVRWLFVGSALTDSAAAASFAGHAGARWPNGLAIVSPDLPNRDPLLDMAKAPEAALPDAAGALNPETPRSAEVVWRPGGDAFASAAAVLAAQFTAGDRDWIAHQLGKTDGAVGTVDLACETALRQTGAGFVCTGTGISLAGFHADDGAGRLERVVSGGRSARIRAPLQAVAERAGARLVPSGVSARLPDGRRIAEIRLSGTWAEVDLADDLGPLDQRIAAATRSGGPPFDARPFDRRRVLALIEALLGGADG